MLVTSLKKTQKDAQEMTLEAQIRARETFIDRTIRRRACSRSQRLEESQKRLEELRAMALVQPVAPQPVDASAEVSRPNCTTGRLSISKSEEGGLRSRHGGGLGVAGRPTGRHEHGTHGWKSCGSSTRIWTDHRCYQKPPSHPWSPTWSDDCRQRSSK